MTTQTHSSSETYFNLHTYGLAYVNRIREVKTKGGKFVACTLAMLRGSSNAVEYTYIDVRVIGEMAKNLILKCQQSCEENRKILVSCMIGDIYPEMFTYEKGKHKGEIGVQLKGRLIKIKSIKIDGQIKYTEESIQHDVKTDVARSTDGELSVH